MADHNINCSVEYDDEWIPKDCHWEVRRFFRFTFDIKNLNFNRVQVFYKFDKETTPEFSPPVYNNGGYGAYKFWSEDYGQMFFKRSGDNAKYIYELNFIDPNRTDNSDEIYKALIANRSDEGNITVTAYIAVFDGNTKLGDAHGSLNYYLQFPAKGPIQNLSTYRTEVGPDETNYPGDFVCEWDLVEAPTANEADSVDGYCVELDYKPEGAEKFSRVLGLSAEVLEEQPGSFYLTTNGDTGEEKEVYLFYTKTQFETTDTIKLYFTPEELGITNGEYRFTVYPYHIYSWHEDYESGNYNGVSIPSALLSSDSGLDRPVIEVPKGIVRVMTEDGWKEGKVWVYTESGWKEACSVFTYTENGWKESI